LPALLRTSDPSQKVYAKEGLVLSTPAGDVCYSVRFWPKADVPLVFSKGPLLGIKRTSRGHVTMSLVDPERTNRIPIASGQLESERRASICPGPAMTRRAFYARVMRSLAIGTLRLRWRG